MSYGHVYPLIARPPHRQAWNMKRGYKVVGQFEFRPKGKHGRKAMKIKDTFLYSNHLYKEKSHGASGVVNSYCAAYRLICTWHANRLNSECKVYGDESETKFLPIGAWMDQMSKRLGLVFNPEALELFAMNKLFLIHEWLKARNVAKPHVKLNNMMRMLGFSISNELYDLIDKNPHP